MYRTLISAEALLERPACRIIDCRAQLGDVEAGRHRFAEGHIPDAVQGDLDRHFAAPPGAAGRHPLPDRSALVQLARSWGINDDTQLVFYDDAGGAFAARGWWLFRWLGHEAAAVLDGGLDAWRKVGGELQRQSTRFPTGNFSERPPLTRTLSALQILEQSPDCLIDARSQARFEGLEEPIDHTAGHIPGAICKPFNDNLNTAGYFADKVELAERFADCAGEVVCYCGSGVTAAHNILAMVHAGLPEPALYPGSWSEWIEDPNRPIAHGR